MISIWIIINLGHFENKNERKAIISIEYAIAKAEIMAFYTPTCCLNVNKRYRRQNLCQIALKKI